MKKLIVGAVSIAVYFATPLAVRAHAQTYRMHIVQSSASVSPTGRANLASANTWFVENRLRPAWNTNHVLFVQSAWNIPIYVANRRGMESYCGRDAAACHGVDRHDHPLIVVGKFDPYFSLYFNHEVNETMVDPHVNRIVLSGDGLLRYVEVSDAVEDVYKIRSHVMLSDFVFRSWFGGDEFGPYDQFNALDAPAPTTTEGGYDPLASNAHKRYNSHILNNPTGLFVKAISIPKR